MKSYLTIFSVLLLFVACSPFEKNEDPAIDYDSLNETQITNYLAKNNLTALKSDSGLYYIITKQGTGKTPLATSTVVANYKGYLLNGAVFGEVDKAEGESLNLKLTIAGFKEGFTYLKEGAEATFIIPSRLAYGKRGQGPIPGGAVILFDVKLFSIDGGPIFVEQ